MLLPMHPAPYSGPRTEVWPFGRLFSHITQTVTQCPGHTCPTRQAHEVHAWDTRGARQVDPPFSFASGTGTGKVDGAKHLGSSDDDPSMWVPPPNIMAENSAGGTRYRQRSPNQTISRTDDWLVVIRTQGPPGRSSHVIRGIPQM